MNSPHSENWQSLTARLGKRDVAARNDGAGGVRAGIGCVLPQEGQRALQRVRRVKSGGYPDLAPLLHLIAAAPPCTSKVMHALRGEVSQTLAAITGVATKKKATANLGQPHRYCSHDRDLLLCTLQVSLAGWQCDGTETVQHTPRAVLRSLQSIAWQGVNPT